MPPGSFIHAVLANDFMKAVSKADDVNIHCLRDIMLYVYNNIPSICWGSPEAVEEWLNPKKEKNNAKS